MSYLTAGLNIDLPEQERTGVGGFLGNLAEGVGDLFGGITTMAGAALGDVGQLAQEGLTLGKAEGDFVTDDMLKALPRAVIDDYSKRYGGGLSGIAKGFYEDPLSYILDATGVASLAGGAAAKGAKALAYADDGARAAQIASTVAEGGELTGLNSAISKILPGVAEGAGKGFAGGTRTVLNPATGRIIATPEKLNPLRRAFHDATIRKFTTEPIENLARRGEELAPTLAMAMKPGMGAPVRGGLEVASELDASKVASLFKTEEILTGTKGVTRAYRAPVANRLTGRLVDKIYGGVGAIGIMDRDKQMGIVQEATNSYLDRKVSQLMGQGMSRKEALAQAEEYLGNEGAVLDLMGANPDMLDAMDPRPYNDPERIADMEADLVSEDLPPAAQPYIEEIKKLRTLYDDPDFQSHDKLDRLIADLYDGAVGHKEGAAKFSPEQWFVTEQNLDVFRGITTDELLEPGSPLTVDEVFERQYLTQKVLDGTIRKDQYEVAGADTARLHGIEAMMDKSRPAYQFGDDALTLDDRLRLQGKKTPTYFPMMDSRKLKVTDFTARYGDNAINKAAGNNRLKKAYGHLIEVLPDGRVQWQFETHPGEVYARAAAQMSMLRTTRSLWKRIADETGRAVRFGDAVAENEVVMNPYGLNKVFRMREEMEQELAEFFKKAGDGDITPDEAVRKILDTAVARTRGEVSDLLETTREGGELVAIPKVAYDRLMKQTGSQFGVKARLAFDTPMQAWKSLVLLGSTRWVLNNLFGNMTFLKMQGGRLRDAFKLMLTKDDKNWAEWLDKLPEDVRHGLDPQMWGQTQNRTRNLGKAGEVRFLGTEKTVGDISKAINSSRVAKPAQKWASGMRALNGHIETAFRRASFMKAAERELALKNTKSVGVRFLSSRRRLEELAGKGLDEAASRRALDEVNFFLNDYNDLAPFERNVVKRFVAPFYSFYKHIVRLALKYPFEYPARAAILDKLSVMTEEFQPQGEAPNFLENALPMGPSQTNPLGSEFMNPRSANPLSGVVDLMGNVAEGNIVGGEMLQNMGPLPQAVIERATGRDILTGNEFTDPNYAKGFGQDQGYYIDPETLEVSPGEPPRPGILDSILGTIPQTELIQDMLDPLLGNAPAGSARYSGGQVMTEFGAPVFPGPGLAKTLLKYAGVYPVQDYDLANYQTDLMGGQDDALAAWLRRGLM